MKKIIMFLLCLGLFGCEKQTELPVNHTNKGYTSEEIATIEIERKGIKKIFLTSSFLYDEDKLFVNLEMWNENDSIDSAFYHVDIRNKTAHKGNYIAQGDDAVEGTITGPYGSLVLETEDYRIFMKSSYIKETIETEENISIGYTNQYYYEKDGQYSLLCEVEIIYEKFDFAINEFVYYDEIEKTGYIIYPTSEGLNLGKIQEGHLEIIKQYPFIMDGFSFSHVMVADAEARVFYKGENSIMLLHKDEQYEFSYKEDILIANDYILVSRYDELNTPIHSYVMNRDTQEISMYQEFVDVKYLQPLNDNQYIYTNPTSDNTKDLYIIEEDLSLTIIHFPFTKQFEYVSVNPNQFVAYVSEPTSELFVYRYYLITLED